MVKTRTWCFCWPKKQRRWKTETINTDREHRTVKASWRSNPATHVFGVKWGGEMATERLQFHEMGIDDRILKVTNWLTLFGNRERAVYETVWRQLMKENCGEVQESRPEHTGATHDCVSLRRCLRKDSNVYLLLRCYHVPPHIGRVLRHFYFGNTVLCYICRV